MNRLSSALAPGLLAFSLSTHAQVSTRSLLALDHFPLPDGEVRLVWDAERAAIYCADPAGQRVQKLALTDGAVLGELTWTNSPDQLALSPNGGELFVTLPIRPHDGMWFEDQWGYVSVIDPVTFAELRRFRVDIDPYDIAPTSEGTMIVSSGSGQWTYLDTYDAITGGRLGTVSGVIPQLARLTLHAGGDRLYLADYSVLQRLDRDPGTRAFQRPGDPVGTFNDAGGRVWIHPDGNRLLAASGAIYHCDSDPARDLQVLGQLETSLILALHFDQGHRTLFTADQFGLDATLRQWDLESLTVASRYPIPGRPLSLFANRDHLWIAMLMIDGTSTVMRFVNPAIGAETNTPPTAAFTWAPAQPTTIQPVRLDAGPSTDAEHPHELWFRWDLDGDGIFDAEYRTNRIAEAAYHVAGTRTVGLEVRDPFGAVSTTTRSIEVSLAEDPGEPGPPHAPSTLPFEAARVAFDAARGRLYATDPAGKRLAVVNLHSGQMIRQFRFFLPPESVALTPDGRQLYVALLAAPHDSFASGGGSGYVAVFDLDRLVKTREFAVSVDPGALLATDAGHVVVGGGSSQSTEVQSYHGGHGQWLGSISARELSPLALLPSQVALLVMEEFAGNAWVSTLQLDPNNGMLTRLGGSDLLIRGGALAVMADASLAATANGSVFSLTPDGLAALPAWNLPTDDHGIYSAVCFDAPQRRMLFGALGNQLRVFNANSFLEVLRLPLDRPARFLGRIDPVIYTIATSPQNTTIQSIANPVLDSEGNLPPVVHLELQPPNPTTRFPVDLDASKTSDSGPLLFRWDWDGDGTFDTDWIETTRFTRRMIVAGDYRTVVEARDTWGEVGRAEISYQVGFEPDPGEPVPPHPGWELPFSAADAAFDTVRRQLWLTDLEGGAVVRVNLESGQAERIWRFDLAPESLAIAPNRNRLYAALLAHPHDYYWRDQVGYVAEYNLIQDRLERVLQIPLDPGDLLATDQGYLIAAGGSGGDTFVQCYQVEPLTLLGQAPMYNGPRLALAPSQSTVYGVTYWDVNPHLTRFNFNPVTGEFGPGPRSPDFMTEHNSTGGRMLVLPAETNLLSGTGAIWLSQPGAVNDLRVVGDLNLRPVRDLTTVPATPWFAVAADQLLGYFHTNTLVSAGTFQLGRPAQFAGVSGGRLFLVSTNEGRTTIHARSHPATDPASNQAPTVRWLQPAPHSVHAHPAFIPLSVQPEDPDGAVAWVRFFDGDRLLGTATNHPFALEVQGLAPGDHTFTAVAGDQFGATSPAAPLNLRITYRPDVAWLAPLHPTVIDAGDSVLLEVQAEDRDGSVTEVRFFRDSVSFSNLLGTVEAPPWRFIATNVRTNISFIVQAEDNDGVTGETPGSLVQIAGGRGDDFYRPFALAGTNAVTSSSNHDATTQLFEIPITSGAGGRTLWWSWTAPVDGIYQLNTRASDFDTILGVYLGNDIARLTTIATNDDDPNMVPASSVKFAAAAGTEMRIRVDGYLQSRGQVTLELTLSSPTIFPPPNDRFANRTVLRGAPLSVVGSNRMASTESGEPNHAGLAAGPSVWWEWQPSVTGLARINTRGSSFDTVLSVYSGAGSVIHSLPVVAANDDDPEGGDSSAVVFHAVLTNYFIAVTGYAGQTGDIALHLDVTPLPSPPNDAFTNRILLAGSSVLIQGWNVGATPEPTDPYAGFPTGGTTVWYQWFAPGTGTAELAVAGFQLQFGAAAFERFANGDLLRVAYTADGRKPGMLSFPAKAGKEYAILVAGRSGYQGLFTLQLEVPSLNVARLSLLSAEADGSLRIQFDSGTSGWAVLLESRDLLQWTPIQTNWVGGAAIFEVSPGAAAHRFFRAWLEPASP
jgi:hypothetical protein